MPKRKKSELEQDDIFDQQTRTADRRLYCICKSKDDPSNMMIQCDFCAEWYHPQCIDLDEKEACDLGQWHCPGCVETMKQNPCMSSKGLLGFQGRVAPKNGWNDSFPVTDIDETVISKAVTDIDETVISKAVSTKRHKVEGWNLFREGRITGLSSNNTNSHLFFRSQCQAAMRQQTYTVYVCLRDGGTKLKWATCSCPAGIDGACKHFVATMYTIIDLFRQDVKNIPDVKTCTEKLQMWHVRKPITDEPLLFSDIQFVKHDPGKPVKRDLACNVTIHNPIPDFGKCVASDKLKKLVSVFDASGIRLPILDTIKSNNYTPVVPKQQSDANLYSELFDSVMNANVDFDTNLFLDEASSQIQNHFNRIVDVDKRMAEFIEKNTRHQSRSSFWFEQRQYRLTSSILGSFCRMRTKTDPVKTFCDKKRVFTTRSVRHGINYESAGFAKYLEKTACVSCPVGLVVNPEIPFLAVSPDRLVKENDELKLIEIKCPFSIFEKKSKIVNHVKEKSFYLESVDGELTLKKTHDYYYQIQGQLNVTGINLCDLVVFVPPEDMVIVTVNRDKAFFKDIMLPKLARVYFDNLLPYFSQELQSVHV